ncbi:MAG TPA: TetR/AcrR family transcriptional regulator [Candidatus Dormibacteraeota bacterium]
MPEDTSSESRQRILDAATRLMTEHGYSATSISMITKMSGLPASSTYWHFGSKEQLLGAVIESAADTWLRGLTRWKDLHGTPRERLSEMMRIGATDWSAGRPAFLRLIFLIALEKGGANREVLETLRRVRTAVKRTFRRAFVDEYGEPSDQLTKEFADRLASFCLAVADGVFIGGEIDRKQDQEELYQFLAVAFFAIADDYWARRKRLAS